MGLFTEVKCGRCDRRYSGLRARCPYCGARRGKRGKHAKDYDNSKGRLIIGLILITVLIVAAIVVVATSMSKKQNDDIQNNDNQQQNEHGSNIGNSDDITNIDGVGGGNIDNKNDDGNADDDDKDNTDKKNDDDNTDIPATGDDAMPDDTNQGAATKVNSLYISNDWSDDPQGDFTANVGDVIQFGYVTDPVLEDADVKWASSDENVFVILQTGEFTAVGEGTATLSLTVNGTTVELSVYVY